MTRDGVTLGWGMAGCTWLAGRFGAAANVQLRDDGTALTNLMTGRPARGIVNRVMREVGPMSEAAPDFPLAAGALAPLRAKAEAQGSGDFSPLWAGQNASGCREIPAAELTRELARGATLAGGDPEGGDAHEPKGSPEP